MTQEPAVEGSASACVWGNWVSCTVRAGVAAARSAASCRALVGSLSGCGRAPVRPWAGTGPGAHHPGNGRAVRSRPFMGEEVETSSVADLVAES